MSAVMRTCGICFQSFTLPPGPGQSGKRYCGPACVRAAKRVAQRVYRARKPSPRAWTAAMQARADRIAAAYKVAPAYVIAERLGVTPTVVYRALRNAGVPRTWEHKRYRRTDLDRAALGEGGGG